MWRNVWCSSHDCLKSRGNLVVFKSSQFGNTERSSKGLGSILPRSCQPARAGGTMHVFRHPHRHVPEPRRHSPSFLKKKLRSTKSLAGSCSEVRVTTPWTIPWVLLNRVKRPTRWVCLGVIVLHRTQGMYSEPCNHFDALRPNLRKHLSGMLRNFIDKCFEPDATRFTQVSRPLQRLLTSLDVGVQFSS